MSKRMDKTKPFDVLLRNPGGARYYQDGKFYGPGGVPMEKDIPKKELPPIIQQDLVQRPESKDEDKFVCPHCQKVYADQKWLDKHIAGKHE